MTVYKAFFKIILKNLSQIIIYVVIFISLAVTLANVNSQSIETSFTETKVNIAFINNNTDSILVEGLKNYLSKNANIVNIPDEPKKLQDALFFREVEYIVRVPKGFTEGLLNDKTLQIEKITIPDSSSAIYIDSIINKYLNTAKNYISNIENISEEQLLSYIDKDLEQKTKVKLYNSIDETNNNEKRASYFNFMAYALLAILILGVCLVMLVFNDTDIKKRNLCSPMKLESMNFQIILGSLSFAMFTWIAMIFTSFFLYGSYMFTTKGILFLLNSFVFTLAALSISYLLGNVIKSRNAMSAVANVFAMGTSFISGVFVPQALLGETVLNIASFTPTYWYVKSNNIIANLVNFNMENLTPIFLSMFIIIGFAIAILSVTLVMIKHKRVSN